MVDKNILHFNPKTGRLFLRWEETELMTAKGFTFKEDAGRVEKVTPSPKPTFIEIDFIKSLVDTGDIVVRRAAGQRKN